MSRTCTVTVVGDGIVGKTCLLYRYTNKENPVELPYIPTVFENYCEKTVINNEEINIQLWDTAGQEEYDKLRVLAYIKTNSFILCYDVTNQQSLDNCRIKWVDEIRNHSKGPILLAGTKVDLLRENENYKSIESIREEGVRIAKIIKAKKHIMTSAKTGEGVESLFAEAVELGLKKVKKCTIL